MYKGQCQWHLPDNGDVSFFFSLCEDAMGTDRNAQPKRPGTSGLDIFKIAGQSISGYIPSMKITGQREIRCPYTSLPEQMVAMY